MSDATPTPDAVHVEFVTVGQPRDGGWAAVNDAGQPRNLPTDALVDLRTVHPGQRLRTEAAGTRIVRAEIP